MRVQLAGFVVVAVVVLAVMTVAALAAGDAGQRQQRQAVAVTFRRQAGHRRLRRLLLTWL